MDLSFQLENGQSLPVFTRFEGPVRVRMIGAAPPTAARDLSQLIARLQSEAGLDISSATGADAEITVQFLPRRTMQARVPSAACFVAPRVSSWAEYRRAPRRILTWSNLVQREKAAVFIPNDTSPQEVRDCLHEELAQALGPLNDLYRLPDSVFNDDNIHTVLTGFDMLMLRVTYASDLRSGMVPGAVALRLPGILARLNPSGERGPAAAPDPTPRAYIDAIETALGPHTAPSRRRAAALKAIGIAEARGWRDTRLGFAWLALGRLSYQEDPALAEHAFRTAAAVFENRRGYGLQLAQADMQLAAFALSDGRADDVIAHTGRALPEAMAAEDAALLANLLMVRAEALDLLGRASEARQVRLDSMGWARYGFSSDTDVLRRLDNIAALSPASQMRLK